MANNISAVQVSDLVCS